MRFGTIHGEKNRIYVSGVERAKCISEHVTADGALGAFVIIIFHIFCYSKVADIMAS